MKKQFLLTGIALGLMLCAAGSEAQCIADAGQDTTICASDANSFLLGGSPTAMTGTPPYSYAWACAYRIGDLLFTASDLLDDSTSANPRLLDSSADSLLFTVTVTDSAGATCRDTQIIRICHFGSFLLNNLAWIEPGDTISLWGTTFGDGPPIEYLWSPGYNISDPDSFEPMVWPDTTTFYRPLVTDSIGCQVYDQPFEVYVLLTPTKAYTLKRNVRLYPNPASSDLMVELNGIPGVELEIINVYGNLIARRRIDHTTKIDVSGYASGIYFISLESDGRRHTSRIVIAH